METFLSSTKPASHGLNGHSSQSRQKRKSKLFSKDQLSVLNEWFTTVKFINEEEQRYIAETIGLTEMQVYDWFRHQRSREKAEGIVHVPENELSSSKRSRKLNQPTKEQLRILEEAFESDCYPTKKMILEISEKAGMSEVKTSGWFRNRRVKERKAN